MSSLHPRAGFRFARAAMVMEFAWEYHKAVLTLALFSAQLGPVVLWAVFGRERWPIRWPVAAATLMLGAALPLIGSSRALHSLSITIATQTGLLLAICI